MTYTGQPLMVEATRLIPLAMPVPAIRAFRSPAPHSRGCWQKSGWRPFFVWSDGRTERYGADAGVNGLRKALPNARSTADFLANG